MLHSRLRNMYKRCAIWWLNILCEIYTFIPTCKLYSTTSIPEYYLIRYYYNLLRNTYSHLLNLYRLYMTILPIAIQLFNNVSPTYSIQLWLTILIDLQWLSWYWKHSNCIRPNYYLFYIRIVFKHQQTTTFNNRHSTRLLQILLLTKCHI